MRKNMDVNENETLSKFTLRLQMKVKDQLLNYTAKVSVLFSVLTDIIIHVFYIYLYLNISWYLIPSGRNRVVVRFTSSYVLSVYHHLMVQVLFTPLLGFLMWNKICQKISCRCVLLSRCPPSLKLKQFFLSIKTVSQILR